MAFIFLIRPITLEKGFDLSCEGVLRDEVRHGRLIEAIVHAVQLGRDLDGEIRIFDAEGRVAEVLPLPKCAARSGLPVSRQSAVATNATRMKASPAQAA